MAKKKKDPRFTIKNYYPELPEGWALYSEADLEAYRVTRFIEQSLHYQERFLAGDENAIYEFVKSNEHCFREVWKIDTGILTCYSDNNVAGQNQDQSWVIKQIEKWKAEGTKQSKAKLKKLFTAYIDSRGNPGVGYDFDNLVVYRYIEDARLKGLTVEEAINNLTREDYKKLGISCKGWDAFQKIYYGLKALEDDVKTTEANLRFEYFFPTKGITISKKYKEQFLRELSLYWQVELLTTGAISFPHYRHEAYIYPDYNFNCPMLPLDEAINKVSEDKNINIENLTEIYRIYSRFASYNR
ncbi:MAG: hypothetical protein NTX75_08450 [Proteobacteria bacterium]|nr:hypothetical protein [Pseudomonadota bacterium]